MVDILGLHKSQPWGENTRNSKRKMEHNSNDKKKKPKTNTAERGRKALQRRDVGPWNTIIEEQVHDSEQAACTYVDSDLPSWVVHLFEAS